ncbi:hypothetical protein ACFE04_001074 [Oxalis oulophora]
MPPLLYESLIQRCTSITSLTKARQIHAVILTATSPHLQTPYLHNNLLSMYTRCGSLNDAQKVFDKMPQRNVVSYNALIAAYSKDPSCRLSVFRLNTQMTNEGLNPNGSTFTSLIQASCGLEDDVLGSLIHGHVLKFGVLDNVCVQTSLLGMYSKCGDLVSTKMLFCEMSDKDEVTWNSMIYGNLKNGKVKESLELFNAMVMSGVYPTQFTYTMVLNACSRLGKYVFGKLIHARMIVSKLRADLPLQNSMLDMYCNCGDTESAFKVFSRMKNPDLISWNSIIAGYMENGYEDMAMHLLVQLQGLSNTKPDEYTFAAVISTCGKPLHGQVIKVGYETSLFIGTALLSMYLKKGDSESAQKVFESISDKDVVLWTEMIMGHCRISENEMAIGIFCKMLEENGHICDSFAISGVLSACADLPVLKQGEMIHSLALKTGNVSEISICGSLIDMYAKNGNLKAAQSIFSEIPNPDLKCWNSMLSGYGNHGLGDEALNLFEEISKHGIIPDQITFLSLLAACSHSGMVEKGKFFWNYMNTSGIFPGFKHYSCMVALLSRAGLLNEAKELIIESNFGETHLELWRILLSSCVNNRNLIIGVYAAEQILRLNPGDTATYILLCNLYAAMGKWETVAEMRRVIKEMMIEKDPGLSWIEVEKGIHIFSAGDQLHPNVGEAEAELKRLKGNMVRYNEHSFLVPAVT